MKNGILSVVVFGVLSFGIPVIVAGQACAPASPSLVSFWPGEGSANDLQGTNHGTLQNGAGFTDAGKVGPSFTLDGTDDQVVLPSINVGTTYTVEFWVYPTRNQTFQHLFSNAWDSLGNYGAMYFGAGSVSYWQGQSLRSITNVVIPLNQWTHVALTYDGAVSQIFINGVPSGLPSVVHAESFNNPAQIGFNVAGESSHFQGRIDEVSLYNTALAPGQISFIYNAGRSGKCIAPSLVAGDASVLEVNVGTSNLSFPISSIRSTAPATVDYATADGTATAPADYIPTSGNIGVPASGTATVTVVVNGDTAMEQNETLFLNLTNASGASIADTQAIGTIFSDDCANAPAGLRNWWRADGNADDSMGSADGTLEFGTGFTTGIRGQAFSFDGANNSVLTPTVNLGSAYTVEFWMYPTRFAFFQETVSNNYQTAMYGSLYLNGDHMEYWQGFTTRNSSSGIIPLNQWTHVALTYDGVASQLYINGAQSGPPSVHPGEVFDNPLRFGYAIGAASLHFQGLLDEITLFNRALSPGEIQAIYSAFGGGVCLAPTAASVEVSGRVVTPDGRGVRGARVSISDQAGALRTALTGSFGYYRFDDVTAGRNYVVSASAKGYNFPPRAVTVLDAMTDVDFVGEPSRAVRRNGNY